jgi:hypothetical protein
MLFLCEWRQFNDRLDIEERHREMTPRPRAVYFGYLPAGRNGNRDGLSVSFRVGGPEAVGAVSYEAHMKRLTLQQRIVFGLLALALLIAASFLAPYIGAIGATAVALGLLTLIMFCYFRL